MDTNELKRNRDEAIETARYWWNTRPLFLDTETTGLDTDAQICDISIIDVDGNVLLSQLVNPLEPIPQVAIDVHHITNDMVKEAPVFRDLIYKIRSIVTGRFVLTYSADYDMRMIYQSLGATAIRKDNLSIPYLGVGDIMQVAAQFIGDWNEQYGSFRWKKQEEAARYLGLVSGEYKTVHRAQADAEMARTILFRIATFPGE